MSTPTKYEGHTPGPWEARKGNGWAVVSLAAKQWPNHDASKSITGWGCVTQTEADARLIADAPALLAENTRLREALRFTLEYAKCGEYESSTNYTKQETTWHCFGCYGEGFTRWPEWKLDFEHQPDCRYKNALALAAGKGETK